MFPGFYFDSKPYFKPPFKILTFFKNCTCCLPGKQRIFSFRWRKRDGGKGAETGRGRVTQADRVSEKEKRTRKKTKTAA